MKKTVPLIGIDQGKCVNCHACIAVCPVCFCNNGCKDHVSINHDLCIGCGECLAACKHGARYILDDFHAFISDLKAKKPMVAIVAPSIVSNFPGLYLNLNGWLKSLGIEAVFDVSFGAELSVKSYTQHIKNHHPKTVVSPTCPVIVNYIELYRPELLDYIAPAYSPMLHTIKMIKTFYPEYSRHKILILSPCIAKKREFVESGMGDYNVTYVSIANYLKNNGIELAAYPETEYNNPPAERAVLFSSPGGLLETVAREIPDIRNKTRRIEGPDVIYKYLDGLKEQIDKGNAPLLVDCLNCEKGCNGGTGTLSREKMIDEIEHLIAERRRLMQGYHDSKKNKWGIKKVISPLLKKSMEDYWRPGLYDVKYHDLSAHNTIIEPTEQQYKQAYRDMLKIEPRDFLNCGSCGYGSCKAMAKAIINGMNKPSNCAHYNIKLLYKALKTRS